MAECPCGGVDYLHSLHDDDCPLARGPRGEIGDYERQVIESAADRILAMRPEPVRPLYEVSADGTTWRVHVDGTTCDDARLLKRNGVLMSVRLARGVVIQRDHYDWDRWHAIALLEAEDQTPLKRLVGMEAFDPSPAMLDGRERRHGGIATLDLPPPRTPFVMVGEEPL